MRSPKRVALLTALALLGLAAVRGRLRRYEIAERSMAPTLRPGDYVIAQLRKDAVARGEIVIFDHPEIPGYGLVKRVVGLPGEHLILSNGQVHCNDATVAEPWADGPTFPDGGWQLGQDEVFILGDNRAESAADSRTLGPVDLGSVKWRVVARYWPPQSIGRIGS